MIARVEAEIADLVLVKCGAVGKVDNALHTYVVCESHVRLPIVVGTALYR